MEYSKDIIFNKKANPFHTLLLSFLTLNVQFLSHSTSDKG